MNKGYKCDNDNNLFNCVITDLKSGTPVWEDFIVKATKMHSQLKATISSSTAFLDAFQKIADLATSTRGGTKDVGSALTRLCLRHRSVEARLKAFTSSIMDCLILPLQDRLEEWKKATQILDKEHAKEFKRLSSSIKMHKKMKAGGINSSLSKSMESVDCHEKWSVLEEMEKRAVRRALIEERSRFCLFVTYLNSVVEEELAMFHEFTHLKEVMDSLTQLTSDPFVLPSSSELVISDMKITSNEPGLWLPMNLHHTPPSSPSSFGSRKSSLCSISSYNSSSSESPHHIHSHHNSHSRYRSLSQPVVPSLRMLSISSQASQASQDSGFISHPDYSVTYQNAINANGKAFYIPEHEARSNPHFRSEHEIRRKVIDSNNDFQVSSLSSESPSSTPSVHPKESNDLSSALPSQSSQVSRPQILPASHDLPSTRISVNQYCDPSASHENLAELRQGSSEYCTKNCGNSSIQSRDINHADCEPQSAIKTESLYFLSQEFASDKIHTNSEVTIISQNKVGEVTQRSRQNDMTKSLINSTYADPPAIEESNKACSEGSITPTNVDRAESPSAENSLPKHSNNSFNRIDISVKSATLRQQNCSESQYSSTATLSRSSKPVPPPPVRRTSSISDPNAITLGTLRNAGVSTYEEIKALKRSIQKMGSNQYEELDTKNGQSRQVGHKNMMSTSLTSLVEPIYSTLDSSFSPVYTNRFGPNNPFNAKSPTYDFNSIGNTKDDQSNQMFQIYSDNSSAVSRKSVVQMAHEMDENLPPPPPEAYSDSESHYQSGHNRITNMRKEFLQTLNAKLSIPQNQRISPKMNKRRSISLSNSDQEWDSDSALVSFSPKPNSSSSSSNTNSHPESLAQSLVKRLSGHGSTNHSTSSFTFRRGKSSESGQHKSISYQVDSQVRKESDYGSNSSLSRVMMNSSQQASQVAKAAATEAIRRKKSLSECSNSSSEYTSPRNNPSDSTQSVEHFQKENICFESDRISSPSRAYQSPAHQYTQSCLSTPKNSARRSSQPTMGVTLSTNRQQNYINQQQVNNNKNKDSGPVHGNGDSSIEQNCSNSMYEQTYDSRTFTRHNSFPSEETSQFIMKDTIYSQTAKPNNVQVRVNFSNSSTSNTSGAKVTGKVPNAGIAGAIENAIAARVHNWIASRASTHQDILLCRETLMDQIRKGKQLRKVSHPD